MTRLAFCKETLDLETKTEFTKLGYITNASSKRRFRTTLETMLARTTFSSAPKMCLLLAGNICLLMQRMTNLQFVELLLQNGWMVHQHAWCHGFNPRYLDLQHVHPNFKISFLDNHLRYLRTPPKDYTVTLQYQEKQRIKKNGTTSDVECRFAWMLPNSGKEQILIGFRRPLFQLIC